jgi:hypothetical protein
MRFFGGHFDVNKMDGQRCMKYGCSSRYVHSTIVETFVVFSLAFSTAVSIFSRHSLGWTSKNPCIALITRVTVKLITEELSRDMALVAILIGIPADLLSFLLFACCHWVD